MEEKRTLIETFLPVEEISAEAKKEKSGRAPTFELHYWWTRKPLVAARATILSSILPHDFDIIEFKKMIGLGRDKRAHNYDLSKSQLDKLRKESEKIWHDEYPNVLDPFAGGGSIPFEALRIGCKVTSNDYSPMAFLIQKGTIEFPAKYGDKLLHDVEIGLDWLFNKVKDEMEGFYPKNNAKDPVSYIYSWVVSCPECGFKSPLVGQWWLVKTPGKKIYLEPKIISNELKFEIKSGDQAPPGTVTNGKGKCLKCGTTIKNDHIVKEINENSEEILLAVVISSKTGKKYVLPDDINIETLNKIKNVLNENWDFYLKEDLVPLEEIPIGDVRSAKYLKYWYKILNPRQLLLFITLIKSIKEYKSILNNVNEEYSSAVILYLSFVLGKHVPYNCRSSSWHRTREIVSDAMRTRSPGMMWDHLEVNPFIKGSGSFHTINKAILKSLRYSIEKLSYDSININNNSIIDSNFKVPIIVTDPPYFDDVIYAELSEFFYVLEKRALKTTFKLPLQTPKNEDLSVSKNRSKDTFEHLFTISCIKMNDMLTDNGILVMYFAHSSVKAWDFVVNALRKANFRITATWPIHTESPNNPIARDKASILSSIVIVARKRFEDKKGYIEEIKVDMEVHLRKRLQEFWDYGLRGADITVAAMGASLDILTQYSEIKSYTGEMTVKDILELVELYVVEYILEKFLKDSESLDSTTRFYVYCRLSELDGMSFDTANLISKSLHIDLKSLESAGIINSITKGRNKGIKLLKYDERENIEVKTLIDAVQFSMLAYEKGGIREFESVLADVPYTQGEIYNILESFKHLESGDSEKQIAMQILGKSGDMIPEKGQTTFE